MSYELFCEKIRRRAYAAGLYVKFDHVDGKHIAYLSNGDRIYANSIAPSAWYRKRNQPYREGKRFTL